MVIVVDNARNMNVALRDISFAKIACFAHTLQLIVLEALKCGQIPELLGKCRRLVGHFKHSSSASESLVSMQKLFNLLVHKLKQEVPTRWNSTLDMLVRLQEQRVSILNVLEGDASKNNNDGDMLLKSEDWVVIHDLITILEPYKLATEGLCGEQYVSSSIVLPCVKHLLFITAENTHKCSSSVAKQMAKALIIELKARYSFDDCEYLKKASFFDPKFKSLTFLNCDQAAAVKQIIINELICRPMSQSNNNNNSDNIFQSSENSGMPNKHKAKKLKSSLEKLMFEITSNAEDTDPDGNDGNESLQEEVSSYLQNRITSDSSLSCLEWWKANHTQFLKLSVLARKYLCIPATSVPSERLFSASGHVASCLRSSLLPKNVEMLTFLHQNIK